MDNGSARRADLLIRAQHQKHLQRPNILLARARRGQVDTDVLCRLVQADLLCLRAETVAYATLLARFPDAPSSELFIRLNDALRSRLPELERCADVLSVNRSGPPYQPRTFDAFAFPGTVSWVALHADRAAAALAIHTDFAAYFPLCQELVRLLDASGTDVPEEFRRCYDTPPPSELLDLAAEVVEDGLRHGDAADTATAVADLLRAGLDGFWQFAAHGPSALRSGAGSPAPAAG
ncbi:hypothetical protein GCM10023347_30050 [Streptomyces chumphonensis]|uniref:Thiaminase-2/PQQC domain-containing protein n=1 Tax=Streptomyces chumphonensis TaxID=1214925 RepID=A0A927IBQ9_9ACTN|nr:hypothetical protein [Streptomyces chumphonensis]MBD3931125.1 hypothetical protein [Streptomyces chumphonensis]